MSRSLSIECDWLDQPSAVDPVERRTWAGVRIQVAGRFASRLWDREAASERHALYIPAFPIARWLIENWWPLLCEPSIAEAIPPAGTEAPLQRDWLARHCIRAAEAGLLLPRLCLFGTGRGVCAQWVPDEPDAYPSMPGSFVGSDLIHLDTSEAEGGLREFVVEVLARVADVPDSRVARARAHWDAILRAEADERFFCRAAGSMGLDPYASEGWPRGLSDLLESGLGDDLDSPLVQDFLEAAQPDTAEAQWKWTRGVEQSLSLGATPKGVSRTALAFTEQSRPAKTGYSAAQGIRAGIGMSPGDPVEDLSDVSQALKLGALVRHEVNHVPNRRVQAVVGWGPDHRPAVAGPVLARDDNRRFLEARGLYHALYACDQGARLATRANTWDQQASRAFAAELLAPRAALLDEVGQSAEDSDLLFSSLANRFRVSPRVIEYQLENAGVSRMD
jgi:Zn-dependent peptidase ImmA (M78 family)